MNNEDQRKSDRETKGKAPKRYGLDKEEDDDVKSVVESVISKSSVNERAMERRKAKELLNAPIERIREKLSQLDIDNIDLEAEIMMIEDNIKTLSTEEEGEDSRAEIRQLRTKLILTESQLKKNKVLERELKIKLDSRTEEKEDILNLLDNGGSDKSSNRSQRLSDDEEHKESQINSLMELFNEDARLSPVPSNASSVDMSELQRRYAKFKQDDAMKPEVRADAVSGIKEMQGPVASDDPITNVLVQLAQSQQQIAQVLERQSSSKSDKFMARQAAGKDLPYFYGNPEEWPAFIAAYKSTTEMCQFSDAENIQRLRKCLKGDAWKSVKCLMVSPSNLPEVIQNLTDRFGKSKNIIQAMIASVRRLPAVKEDKPQSLIEFGTAVINLSATIKSLEATAFSTNPQLILELEEKLPVNVRRGWEFWKQSKNDVGAEDVSVFAEWIRTELKIAYNMVSYNIPKEIKEAGHHGPHPKHQRDWRDKWGFHKEEKVFSAEEGKGAPSKKVCGMCKSSDHLIHKCSRFKALGIEDRRAQVKESRLCFNCMYRGHNAKECNSKYRCGQDGCEKKHHRLLHMSTSEPAESVACIFEHLRPPIRGIVGIVEVTLKGPRGSIKGFGFVDPGATVSLIDGTVAETIGLDGKKSAFCIKGFNAVKHIENSKVVNLKISGNYRNAKEIEMSYVKTVPELDLGPLGLDMKELKKKHSYLKDLPVKSYRDVRPLIVIGASHSRLTEPLKIVGGGNEEPRAYKSRLGWYVTGARALKSRVDFPVTIHYCDVDEHEGNDADLHEMVKRSFSTEDFGVKVTQDKPRSKEDNRALQLLENTTKRVEAERFETGLLWKTDEISLPESRTTALHRLYCQERKMDKNPDFAKAYQDKMTEYEEKDFIRKLSVEELRKTNQREWYLPHFGVLNPNKPGKLRLVFDAAAESKGISLNKMLVQGPDLNNSIVSVLMKFRQFKVAFAGDVKDMFHRVLIQPEDHHSQRFLWRGMRRDKEPDVYEMKVMVFGSTSSPCSAQYVKNKNAEEHKEEFPDAAKAIMEKFYVDDYLDSRATEEEAIQIIQEVTQVQKKASFQVCNWISNSVKVMASIPEDLRSGDLKNLDLDATVMPTGRILGMWWNQEEDYLTFRLNFHKVSNAITSGEKRPTKREVLKLVMSVYDPLGLVAHLLVKGKIIMQDSWRAGLGFDDEVTDSINQSWQNFIEEIQRLPEVRIPRCYSLLIPDADRCDLHIFCDASEKAFAAVAYLRVEHKGKIDVNLILAKTRVAPLKPISIPRLELQAAVMGARMKKIIDDELEIPITKTFYHTDSRTVLCWLQNDARRFKQFVSHRLGEILETSEVHEWRWVPTKENVADDATRDSLPSDLSPSSRWFHGPEFLKRPEVEWPKQPKQQFGPTSEELELKGEQLVATAMSLDDEDLNWDDSCQAINVEKFSKYERLLRVTGWTRRFYNNYLKINPIHEKELTLNEMEEAHDCWIRRSQKDSFKEEMKSLNGGKPLPGKSSLASLLPIVQDGIIKMRTRLLNSDLPEGMKMPIILDPKHKFTQLLVDSYHREFGHQGHDTVATALRGKYWILNMQAAVKKAFGNCMICRLKKAKPSNPMMGNLPKARLEANVQPFQSTGLDYFGPFMVKIGRRREKRWGALFTCLSTRAVHLEIAGNLSTDSAIMAINRFVNRRGAVQNIYSDNGTNFHGADNELQKVLKDLNQEKIQASCVTKGAQWHFNPPAAPHMGGVWERLVGSVKKVMNGLLEAKEYSEEVMMTTFTEIERIVNSRPLTHISVDPSDPQPLTPNHFLLGWRNGNLGRTVGNGLALGEFGDEDLWLRKGWRQAQRMADHFWTRWVKEYLPTLMRRTKWNKISRPIKLGDIVVVADDQAPRNMWMLGRVVAVFPGKDGAVRVVDVKTKDGVYRRPVTKLCQLDITSSDGGQDKGLKDCVLRGEECCGEKGVSQ